MAVQADAIANYSHLFRRSEGLYLSFSNQESMEEDFLEQIKGRDIDLVVCSDSEAILGIGDQGVGVNLSIFLPDALFMNMSTSLGNRGISNRPRFPNVGLTTLTYSRSQRRKQSSTRERAQPCQGDSDQSSLVFLRVSIPPSLYQ